MSADNQPLHWWMLTHWRNGILAGSFRGLCDDLSNTTAHRLNKSLILFLSQTCIYDLDVPQIQSIKLAVVFVTYNHGVSSRSNSEISRRRIPQDAWNEPASRTHGLDRKTATPPTTTLHPIARDSPAARHHSRRRRDPRTPACASKSRLDSFHSHIRHGNLVTLITVTSQNQALAWGHNDPARCHRNYECRKRADAGLFPAHAPLHR
jgi:hypothetical protein